MFILNPDMDQGFTPLHLAAVKGNIDIARMLIVKGAAVNARAKIG